MKRLLALLLVAMLLSLAACGTGNTDDPIKDNPSASQTDNQSGASSSAEDESGKTTTPNVGENETVNNGELPATGFPIGWPDNDYTKLVPAPNCGGKVISANEIGQLFAVDLSWDMAQGLTYAQLLQDAGFGEDCVEKYEKYGYIDRTYNGVNVQLLDLFGTTTLSIMPVETE